jgi:hypothetical protein
VSGGLLGWEYHERGGSWWAWVCWSSRPRDRAVVTPILSVNSVQQDVQQRGRIITRVRDRTHRWLAAKVALSWARQ